MNTFTYSCGHTFEVPTPNIYHPTAQDSVYHDHLCANCFIESKRVLCNGARINSPGKFQGELDYVPFMWEHSLSGFVQDIGQAYFVTLDSIGHTHKNLYGAQLWEDGNGFIRSEWYATLEEFSCAVTQAEIHEMLLSENEDADDY